MSFRQQLINIIKNEQSAYAQICIDNKTPKNEINNANTFY
jgi:hypothetical protein